MLEFHKYFLWFASSALALIGLFAVAAFAASPYSIIALCLVPIPFASMVIATVANWRRVLRKLRASPRQ